MTPTNFGLIPLPLPYPEILDWALNYLGDDRYYAVYGSFGDVIIMDSDFSYSGRRDVFWQYVNHPVCTSATSSLALGRSDEESCHALLFDRQTRLVYYAGVGQTTAFMRRFDAIFRDVLDRIELQHPLPRPDQAERERIIETLDDHVASSLPGLPAGAGTPPDYCQQLLDALNDL